MFGSDYDALATASEAGVLRRGIAEPDQIKMLARIVNDYCERHRIASIEEREAVAIKIMCVFGRGIDDPDQLSAELEKVG